MGGEEFLTIIEQFGSVLFLVVKFHVNMFVMHASLRL